MPPFFFAVFKWDSDPIWKLPALNLTFEGDRSRAQAMCKALALSWGTAWKEEEGSVGRGAKSRKDAGEELRGRVYNMLTSFVHGF